MDPRTTIEQDGRRIASKLIRSQDISGEDEEDTALLTKACAEAHRYVSSFGWCDDILSCHFGGGLAGAFAVFFFHIRTSRSNVDPWIWAAVGDVPPAYLPLTDCKSPSEFFRTYLHGMRRWVQFARLGKEGTPEEGIPPVSVPATEEWADDVERRLNVLSLVVAPFFNDESEAVN